MNIRQPAVAGMFYPKDPRELSFLIKSYIDEAKDIPFYNLRGGIVPHAGYLYSGPVAGVFYKQMQHLPHRKYTIFLMGPAHYEFTSISVGEYDAFLTPLGDVPVNTTICTHLVNQGLCRNETMSHIQEHSLEVQVPFLQTVLDDFSIIPLLCGDCSPKDLVKIIQPFWEQEDCLFIVSSDLSHYLPYDMAQDVDKESLEYISSVDMQSKEKIDGCGSIPIQALMQLAQTKGATFSVLDYRNSGDTAGDKNKVVGYGAVGLYEKY